jgi:hypothetical protein
LTSALFLVTPGLAKWFTKESSFHQEAINHIYAPVLSDHTPSSLVAIVDAIPAPYRDSKDGKSTIQGSEGIAICLLPDIVQTVPAIDPQQEQALIRFHSSAGQTAHKDTCMVSATLSAANTLFLNGSISTMFKQAWKHKGDSKNAIWSPHDNPVSLKHLGIPIPRSPLNFSGYTVPLQPITRARKIISSMGNVLRELEGDSDAILKASTELEQKVPQFLKAKEAAGLDGSVQVFALVMPPTSTRNLESQLPEFGYGAGQSNAPEVMLTGKIVNEAIFTGGRLLRVTGGGGGWGKKQGLLSLDANVNFSGGENSMASMFPAFEDDTTSESLVGPEELLPPGHTAQFYVTWVGQQDDLSLTENNALKGFHHNKMGASKWCHPTTQNYILGTTIANEITTSSETFHEVDPQEGHLPFKTGSFGMLSYSGLCIAREKLQDEKTIYSTLSPEYSTTHEFRIDVPHTVLRMNWDPPENGSDHPSTRI